MIREAKRGIGAAGVPEGTEVIDCRGKIVAPGLIDMRAFVGEPGAEYRETIASASQAAAAGGVTTVVRLGDATGQRAVMNCDAVLVTVLLEVPRERGPAE